MSKVVYGARDLCGALVTVVLEEMAGGSRYRIQINESDTPDWFIHLNNAVKEAESMIREGAKLHLNKRYGKSLSENEVQIKHDGLPSGYVTDKELFMWALDGVERRIDDVSIDIALDGETVQTVKNLECLKAKVVYLKEVLDGLG